MDEQIVSMLPSRSFSGRLLLAPFFSCSPRSKTTKGGEPMMIATLMIGTAALAAMVAGYVAMVRG